MGNTADRLLIAVKAAAVPAVDASIGKTTDRTTWKVFPASVQAQAQPTIDTVNLDSAAIVDAELDAQITTTLDDQRLISAVVWAILDTYAEFKPATIPKFNAARTKIIAFYKAQPWKP